MPAPGGCRLRLRVSPGASRRRIIGPHGGALKLSVGAAPEKGKANREVLDLVAQRFAVDSGDLVLLSGKRSPDKVVLLPLSADEASRRWEAG